MLAVMPVKSGLRSYGGLLIDDWEKACWRMCLKEETSGITVKDRRFVIVARGLREEWPLCVACSNCRPVFLGRLPIGFRVALSQWRRRIGGRSIE